MRNLKIISPVLLGFADYSGDIDPLFRVILTPPSTGVY
jgi:hypothetical protein